MVPIEQKDGTEQDRASKPGEITHSIPRRGTFYLSMISAQTRSAFVSYGKTGFHPATSAGQAFSGSCSKGRRI